MWGWEQSSRQGRHTFSLDLTHRPKSLTAHAPAGTMALNTLMLALRTELYQQEAGSRRLGEARKASTESWTQRPLHSPGETPAPRRTSPGASSSPSEKSTSSAPEGPQTLRRQRSGEPRVSLSLCVPPFTGL